MRYEAEPPGLRNRVKGRLRVIARGVGDLRRHVEPDDVEAPARLRPPHAQLNPLEAHEIVAEN